jgi:hypothetical protein
MHDFGRAYFSFSADVWMTSLKIVASYASRATDRLVSPGDGQSPRRLLDFFLLEMRNCGVEMGTVVPFALERLSLDESLARRGYFRQTPRNRKMYRVGDKPVMLPVRISDASQGWALYFVNSHRAQSELEDLDQHFEVIDVGNRRCPLVIIGADHRESDLGAYNLIGVALFVKPRDNPLPGMLFLSLIANEQFASDATQAIWGYETFLAKDMIVKYDSMHATFRVNRHDTTAFSASFPRFGRGRSTDIPYHIYCKPKSEADVMILRRSVVSRSSADEGIQIGGAVQVQLGAGTETNCTCRFGSSLDRCICSVLRELELSDRPAANGWAEFMSGTLGEPQLCK